MNAYRTDFDETECMSFLMKDEEFLDNFIITAKDENVYTKLLHKKDIFNSQLCVYLT